MPAITAEPDRIRAEVGADGALLDHPQLDRQLARAQRMARSLALSTVKLPEICAEPPRIGSLMLGAESTTSSRMIANGLPTFSWVTRAKRRAPCAVEADVDDRLVGLLVEALLGVDQLVAGDHRPALHGDAAACPRHRQHLAAGRGAALRDLARIGGEVDQLELEPRGLAEQRLQPLGILEAGDLDEDAVAALADDGGFARARPGRCGCRRPRGRYPSRCRAPRRARPAVGAMTMRLVSTTLTFQSRWPPRPTGWVWLRAISTAASTWAGLRTMKVRRPPSVEISPISMRGSLRRISARIVSSICSSRCLATSLVSASSSRWLPPARSRPRLMRELGRKLGHVATWRFGHEARDGEQHPDQHEQADTPRSSSAGNRASVVRGLGAVRPDFGERPLDRLDAHVGRDLDLDLIARRPW